jgi:H+/Cl- antiporter ClcA
MLCATSGLPAVAVWRMLLPGFVAAGVGALVFTGVAEWPGVHEQSLAMPGLPAYPTVRLVDLAWCLPLAAGVAAVVVSVRRTAVKGAARAASVSPLARLVIAGIAVGALAAVFRVLSDRPVDLVLFSGQPAMGALITEGSAGVLLAVVAFKGLGYALSLAGGFRGGPIFPAVALGLAAGVLGAQVLPGLDLAPAAVAGVAAGAAAVVGLPIFGAVLAILLAGHPADTAPIAILASMTSWLVALQLGPAPEPERGPAPQARITPGRVGA